MDRAYAYSCIDEFEKAIADYDMAIKLDRRSAHAYLNRGFSKTRLQMYQAAVDDFTRAIEIEPSMSISHTMQCTSYLVA